MESYGPEVIYHKDAHRVANRLGQPIDFLQHSRNLVQLLNAEVTRNLPSYH
jgi:hypothetical protein